MSVLRFNSLSRMTSWRSDSSFPVRMLFSLRKPSSQRLLDLTIIQNKMVVKDGTSKSLGLHWKFKIYIALYLRAVIPEHSLTQRLEI